MFSFCYTGRERKESDVITALKNKGKIEARGIKVQVGYITFLLMSREHDKGPFTIIKRED